MEYGRGCVLLLLVALTSCDDYCRHLLPKWGQAILLSATGQTGTYICPKDESFYPSKKKVISKQCTSTPDGLTPPTYGNEFDWMCKPYNDDKYGTFWQATKHRPRTLYLNATKQQFTDKVFEPWWLSDLGKEYYVDEVFLQWASENKPYFPPPYRQILEVAVLKSWKNSTQPGKGTPCGHKEYHYSGTVYKEDITIECNKPVLGRYVVVRLVNVTTAIEFNEFNVFARKPCEKCDVHSDVCYCEFGMCSELSNNICVCAGGYTGKNCETEFFDGCDISPCQNGGTCDINYNVSRVNSYICWCQKGFAGLNCEDTDECVSNPCTKANSKCVDNVGGYTCVCLPGYSGDDCEEDNECDSDPCLNGASCRNKLREYECACLAGYIGQNCETQVDECESRPCENNGTCVDKINEYSCECQSGYMGQDCMTDADECNSDPCEGDSTCINGYNQYVCHCTSGFTGANCGAEIDECASGPCNNNGTCSDMVQGYVCKCIAGYTGHYCESEVTECTSNLCLHGGSCQNMVNKYKCDCLPGFEGKNCQINIDECRSDPCRNLPHAICMDKIDEYACTCIPGYYGKTCEKAINECSSDPCKNNAYCEDLHDKYICHCNNYSQGIHCEECKPGSNRSQCMKPRDICEVIKCENHGTCNSDRQLCICPPAYTGKRCETPALVIEASRVTAYSILLKWKQTSLLAGLIAVLYRKHGQTQWHTSWNKNIPHDSQETNLTVLIDHLEPDSIYEIIFESNSTKSDIFQARTRGLPLIPDDIRFKVYKKDVEIMWKEIEGDYDSANLTYCNVSDHCETKEMKKGTTSLRLQLEDLMTYTFRIKVYQSNVLINSKEFTHYMDYVHGSNGVIHFNPEKVIFPVPNQKKSNNPSVYGGIIAAVCIVALVVVVVIVVRKWRMKNPSLVDDMQSELTIDYEYEGNEFDASSGSSLFDKFVNSEADNRDVNSFYEKIVCDQIAEVDGTNVDVDEMEDNFESEITIDYEGETEEV